jgi:hypothetical protein
LKKAEFLTAEGALIRCENTEDKTTFKISSSLIHNLLLWALRGKIKRKIPPVVPPLKSDGSLDIILLVKLAIQCFDSKTMSSAPSIAYKQVRNRGIKRDTPVPCEACYHFELYYILCTWLGHVYKIYPEVNSDKKSCDVMVERFSTSTRYALELVASADLTSLNEHVNQACIYHKALAAFQTWIINFFYNLTQKQVQSKGLFALDR